MKERVSPSTPFGLGLRLSAGAAEELAPRVSEFAAELDRAGMYAFTINGFPYGRFHGARVKEEVYRPDWSHRERLDYTVRLGEILAALLPEGVDGSVSTSPLAYGKEVPAGAVENLAAAGRALHGIRDRTGRTVRLAVEPEPDCALETTDETVRFFDELRFAAAEETRDHLGVCLDTCHLAVNFERPADALARLEDAGIPVPKIQVSAALRLPAGESEGGAALLPFAEDVYLHQTRVRTATGILRFPDLPAALESGPRGEWRVHFHVPLNFESGAGLTSTADLIDHRLLGRALVPGRHLEIETYTFDVLPGPRGDVVEAVVREFDWLSSRLDGA